MRLRLLVVAAVVAGFAAGVAFPRGIQGSATGKTLSAFMSPVTYAAGQNSPLTCGWHGECTNPSTSGTGLDWDDSTSNRNWYFRGFFAVNTGPGYNIASGTPLVNRQNGFDCNVMTVWIIETHSNTLRAAPTYTHVNITNSSAFNIYGGSFYGAFLDRAIGQTVDESGYGNCPTTGTHAHESDAPIAGTSTTRNTGLYPTGYCSLVCNYYRNDLANNYTRKFVWPEGS